MSVSAALMRARPGRPWRRATFWLLGLAPFFFASYNLANWLASRRTDVGAIAYDWERHIPFVPWTILPYWSIDAFYGLSLFICSTREELDTHGRRLLTAQCVAVICFILFPLRFSFARPTADGFSGFLFDSLASFDRPFNQAPSLHIALLIILWVLYARHIPQNWRWALHLWAVLVGVSVLTTYQHHFIDLPTGTLLGLFCLWLWPDSGAHKIERPGSRRMKLASGYAAAAIVVGLIGLRLGGLWLLLLWAAVALGFTAVNYAICGADGFQKSPQGSMSLAARLLFAPTIFGAWINSRLWTRHAPAPVEIIDGVWLGRIPSPREALAYAALIDLCAEIPVHSGHRAVHAWPMLDLVTPPDAKLREAAHAITEASRPVLVYCALGYSRSAAVVATWLIATGRAASPPEAMALLQRVRPTVVLNEDALRAIGRAAT